MQQLLLGERDHHCWLPALAVFVARTSSRTGVRRSERIGSLRPRRTQTAFSQSLASGNIITKTIIFQQHCDRVLSPSEPENGPTTSLNVVPVNTTENKVVSKRAFVPRESEPNEGTQTGHSLVEVQVHDEAHAAMIALVRR